MDNEGLINFAKNYDMGVRLIFMFLFTVLVSASCQNDARKERENETAPNTETIAAEENLINLDHLRRTLEDKIVYPEDQKIRLDRMIKPIPSDVPRLIYLGHIDGAFEFKQVDSDGNEVDEYFPIHFHWDNFEAVKVNTNRIPFALPEKNHIMCAYLVDEKGHRIPSEESLVAMMLKVENGAITKSDEAPLLIYYNEPRGTYNAKDPFVYLDFIIVNEGEKGMSGVKVEIDGQVFMPESSGTYQIKGLKPGDHMVELTLFRQDMMYNAPMNPSRMQFKIKD